MLFLVRNTELVKDREKTFLIAVVAAAGTTLTVKAVDANAWADDDYIIVGEMGSKTTEILRIAAAVTDGTSLTITQTAKGVADSGGCRFAHSIDEPVYRIDYNQVEFSRNATDPDSSSTTPTVLGSAAELQVDDLFTRYEDTANTTGYGFVRFKNGTTYSSYSDAFPYTGDTKKSLSRIISMVRRRLSKEIKNISDLEDITDEDITEESNSKQRDIAHERLWTFYETIRSASLVAYQRDYAIDDDIPPAKVHTIMVDSEPLAKINRARFDILHFDSDTTGDPTHAVIWGNVIKLYPLPTTAASSTTLNGALTAAATSITLTSISGFRAPGRALIESEVISYEYIDSTNVALKGCQRGLEGTTAVTHNTLTAITERDLIYTGHEEPIELVDTGDETKIPDIDILVNGVCAELAIGKLIDQTLHDRFTIKYDKGLEKLKDKFGSKMSVSNFSIKDKEEYPRDEGGLQNPNFHPTDLS